MTLPVLPRIWHLTALVCLLGMGRGTPALAGTETVALLPLELSGGLEGSRADLESAVLKGLVVAGRPLVPPAASQSGGTYLVHGRIAREGGRFWVKFRLVRAADGSTINDQENHCDVADCSVGELARRSARELVRVALGRPAEVAPEASPPRAQVSSVPARVVSGSDSVSRVPRWSAPAALVAGAAAVGVGIYLVAIDGQCVDKQPGRTCSDFKNTRVGGIASIAGGAVASALGLYLLLHDDPKSGTSVAVGVRPAGLVVAGRF